MSKYWDYHHNTWSMHIISTLLPVIDHLFNQSKEDS
jgi:hypothetical protein